MGVGRVAVAVAPLVAAVEVGRAVVGDVPSGDVELPVQEGAELAELVRRVVVEQVALMLGRRPEEIDPDA